MVEAFGRTAPASIQVCNRAICSAFSGAPPSGMRRRGSVAVTRWRIRLSALLPGTIPRAMPSAVSSRSPPLAFSPLWQFTHEVFSKAST